MEDKLDVPKTHGHRPEVMLRQKAAALLVEMLRIRNLVLVLLVAQTTAIVLLMRYSRTRDVEGTVYVSSVAVLMAELLYEEELLQPLLSTLLELCREDTTVLCAHDEAIGRWYVGRCEKYSPCETRIRGVKYSPCR